MRSLFIRVFLTFWLASALMLLSLAVVTALTNARPLSHRWLMHSLDLYARTAIDAYEEGGAKRLNGYLLEIQGDSLTSAALLRDGSDLAASPIPSGAVDLLDRARTEKQSQYSFGSPWFGVVRQLRGDHVYFFVAQVPQVKMYGNYVDPERSPLRAVLVLLISGTLCGLLARSITKPIRSLQRTAMDIAGGDLAARASPALAGRTDELASLAHDFDRMAERVQLLLEQQKLLLRDISHELRSPLARLTVSAELVQRGDLTAAGRMQSDIKALEKMISDLLTLARIDASDSHSRRESVHVGRLIQRIVKDASFEGATEEKTVVQTGVFDRYISGDIGLLHSCIENVVRNALKHTPTGGVVEVSVTDTLSGRGPMLAITTTDEGAGVPASALEQIFDPFFRIAAPDSHKQGGAGLGLSISKRIATLYGGTIAAQNLPGSGFQVQLNLPAAQPQSAPSLS
jgi:two-component system sensor histidine kinase CpxA